jgi:hypothetical protein
MNGTFRFSRLSNAKSLSRFAKEMSVVAEGVETHERKDLLRDLNCGYGQGHLFSKPVEATLASELLLKGNGPASASNPQLVFTAKKSHSGVVKNIVAEQFSTRPSISLLHGEGAS